MEIVLKYGSKYKTKKVKQEYVNLAQLLVLRYKI